MTSLEELQAEPATAIPVAPGHLPPLWPSLMAFADGPGRTLVARASEDLVRTVQVDLHIARVCSGIRRTGGQVTYFTLNRYLQRLLDIAWSNRWIPGELDLPPEPDPPLPAPLSFPRPGTPPAMASGEAAQDGGEDRTDWVVLRLTAICRLATDPKAMPSPTAPYNLMDLCLEP